jgi:signal transduction histidine kinase
VIFRVDNDDLRIVAMQGPIPSGGTLHLTRAIVTGCAVLEGRTIHVADLLAESDRYPEGSARAHRLGFRTILAVPLMRVGEAIGTITIRRSEVRPFTDRQIDLLTTFADQAVIAIENTRLFEEVQARTRELTEALEQKTATSEVLGVISRSKFDLQPVFDTMAENAVKLCQAERAFIFRFDGNLLRAVASYNVGPELRDFVDRNPIAPGQHSVSARAALERRTVHVPDVQSDPQFAYALRDVDLIRTVLAVPLLRGNDLLGTITIYKLEAKPFTEKQVELVETFADQAVIAIENARLFEAEQTRTRELTERTQELTEALEYQTATSDVLAVISRSKFDLQPVIDTLVQAAGRLCDADAWLFRRQDDAYGWAASYGFSVEQHERIKAYFIEKTFVPDRRGMTSMRAAFEGRPVHILDVLADPDYTHTEAQAVGGFRTTLGVPLLRDGVVMGVLALTRSEVRPFTDKQIELITTFADQAVIAIENTRLFEEVRARTGELAKTVEELEITSQHKSQFVANMSHELRTPLAAILGYAELIQEGFYEPQGPKSLDALTRIRSNGKHLLGLINTVLDIAKIESGQFTLNMAEYAIESIVETVRSATESLAQNKKLALKTEVAKSLPVGFGDEQRLTQVLLNLVGNAIKFTDAGEVRVTAKAVKGHFNVSVVDTGPGIPEHERTRIFEQFHQVDSSLTKAAGGTGLGLAIAKQIVEMHGGRIWVESTLGKGSTFQIELPTRAELRKRAP